MEKDNPNPIQPIKREFRKIPTRMERDQESYDSKFVLEKASAYAYIPTLCTIHNTFLFTLVVLNVSNCPLFSLGYGECVCYFFYPPLLLSEKRTLSQQFSEMGLFLCQFHSQLLLGFTIHNMMALDFYLLFFRMGVGGLIEREEDFN